MNHTGRLERIVFDAYRDTTETTEDYVANAAGGGFEELKPGFGPSWAPKAR